MVTIHIVCFVPNIIVGSLLIPVFSKKSLMRVGVPTSPPLSPNFNVVIACAGWDVETSS